MPRQIAARAPPQVNRRRRLANDPRGPTQRWCFRCPAKNVADKCDARMRARSKGPLAPAREAAPLRPLGQDCSATSCDVLEQRKLSCGCPGEATIWEVLRSWKHVADNCAARADTLADWPLATAPWEIRSRHLGYIARRATKRDGTLPSARTLLITTSSEDTPLRTFSPPPQALRPSGRGSVSVRPHRRFVTVCFATVCRTVPGSNARRADCSR